LDGFEGPEAEMAEDDRIAMLTKVQALYDQAVSTGISSEALLKPMKDQIEIYKNPNPKTKNSERESSYTLLAQAEGAGSEELRYWDAQKARMDAKVKQLQLKVDKAAEYLMQEKKIAREYIEYYEKTENEHSKTMTRIAETRRDLEAQQGMQWPQPTPPPPPPAPLFTKAKLEESLEN